MNRSIIIVIFLFVSLSFLHAQEYNTGDHELFFMPTAETMPKDSAYFASYELIVLNYTYAVTGRTHLSVLMLFPVTPDAFETFSVGVKQNYFRSEKFQGALYGSFTFKGSAFTLGNVFSFGGEKLNGHLGVGVTSSGDGGPSLSFMLGGKYKINKKFSLISEYINFGEEIENSIFSIGIRFAGESLFWDFGGFRPLKAWESDLIMFPFVKGSYLF